MTHDGCRLRSSVNHYDIWYHLAEMAAMAIAGQPLSRDLSISGDGSVPGPMILAAYSIS
jgi:hypothetical protein